MFNLSFLLSFSHSLIFSFSKFLLLFFRPGLPAVSFVSVSQRSLVQTPFPFVDSAKLSTKKMRSNLLKRIQKQKQKVGAESRNF
jgi:hypothetical protein